MFIPFFDSPLKLERLVAKDIQLPHLMTWVKGSWGQKCFTTLKGCKWRISDLRSQKSRSGKLRIFQQDSQTRTLGRSFALLKHVYVDPSKLRLSPPAWKKMQGQRLTTKCCLRLEWIAITEWSRHCSALRLFFSVYQSYLFISWINLDNR